MDSFLASSLYGKSFIKYRINNSRNDRKRFSRTAKNNENDIPVVIDSINETISKELAGPNATRYKRNGMEYNFNKELVIEDLLYEVKTRVKTLDSSKILRIGLENGKILENTDKLGDLYEKYKDTNDDILYLLLTQESSVYAYIISLLKYFFGLKT